MTVNEQAIEAVKQRWTWKSMLWVFGAANSSLTLFGAIAVSESNLSAVQAALVANAAASTIAFITLGIGELIPRRTTAPTRTTLVNTGVSHAADIVEGKP